MSNMEGELSVKQVLEKTGYMADGMMWMSVCPAMDPAPSQRTGVKGYHIVSLADDHVTWLAP